MFLPDFEINTWLGLALLVALYVVGLLHVLHARMNVRTSQGTIAWVLSLLTLPFLAIPLYWLLGRTRFSRNVGGRREKDSRLGKLAVTMHKRLRHCEVDIPEDDAFERAAQILGGPPFTRGNELELLIDGDVTFERIFEAIREAEHYLCVNFFIVKNDTLGTQFQDALIERARAGVKVYFLFDEIGSHTLPRSETLRHHRPRHPRRCLRRTRGRPHRSQTLPGRGFQNVRERLYLRVPTSN